MIATLREAGLAILGHEKEGREEDGLERYDERQHRERVRIEMGGATRRVPCDPPGEPDDVRPDEVYRAAESSDAVGDVITEGACRIRGAVDATNRGDVPSRQLFDGRAACRGHGSPLP